MTSADFASLGLKPWLISACMALKFVHPTTVQRACIPMVLQDLDVMANSKTGSGKTAAFALPILQKLSEDPYGIFALILTPTRELAFQIADQFQVLGKSIALRSTTIVGGQDMMKQAIELIDTKPHVIVATPGRFAELLRCNDSIEIRRLRFLVFDEADRLLVENASFAEDLKTILETINRKHLASIPLQKLFFSATLNFEQMKKQSLVKYAENMFVYESNSTGSIEIPTALKEQYLKVPPTVKDVYLVALLRHLFHLEPLKIKKSDAGEEDIRMAEDKTNNRNNAKDDESNIYAIRSLSPTDSVIIFVNRCTTCDVLREMLFKLQLPCTALHSQMKQHDRSSSMALFRAGRLNILITTDVGSRGLDLPDVKTVINYDMPMDPHDYIHRIGRTARAGRGGIALSFISSTIDAQRLLNVEGLTNKQLAEYNDDALKENRVLKQISVVTKARREASLYLVEKWSNTKNLKKFNEREQKFEEKRKRRVKPQKPVESRTQ